MTSREKFEEFIDENFGFKKDRFRMFRGEYQSQFTKQMWESWQASREAVEVELPKRREYVDTLSDHELGFNIALKQCAEAIRAAGIKVKGE